jgi:membrane-associated protein
MPDLHGLFEALRTAYGAWGYPLVLAGALLENTVLLGLLLPGGSLVLLGAVYAQQGMLSLPLVLVLGWLGMVLGTSIDYALGRWALHNVLCRANLAARLEPKFADARRFLMRHGAWALVVAHFVGHLRSFVAITAGMGRLPYRRFLCYEAVAAMAWNLIWVLAGYALGDKLDRLQRLMGGAGLAVLCAIAIGLIAARVVARLRSRRHAAP